MCSVLLILLIFVIAFDILQDSAKRFEFETQIEKEEIISQKELVSASNRTYCTWKESTSEDQADPVCDTAHNQNPKLTTTRHGSIGKSHGMDRKIHGTGRERSLSRSRFAQQAGDGSRSPRARKGKGKGKTAEKMAASPFAPLAKALPPWPSTDSTNSAAPTGSGNANSTALARDQEAVKLLKQAYPDGVNMPQDSKDFIERVEKETARTVTKSLHSTTTAMDKAQKTLSDALEAKKAHRKRWADHMTEAIKVWKGQLQDYRQQQSALQEVINKSRIDIEMYRNTIRGLTSKTTPQAQTTNVQPVAQTQVEDLTSEGEEEEKLMEEQMQSTLRTCLVSLGVNLQAPSTPTEVSAPMAEEKSPENKKQKRPRSLEPFAGPLAANAGGLPSQQSGM
eukprot:s3226_g11.t1